MTTPTPLLSITDLSVSFETGGGQVDAVKGVSLELLPGETLAIVGESGSGKSTMAASINRLLPANGSIRTGSILFEGKDLAQATEKEMIGIRGAGIGLVPQDPMSNLDPLERVGSQIMETLEVHGRAKGKKAKALAIELLAMVGIHEPEKRFGQFPHEFSGGMRQRVLIAMGLACRPKLLIADEPTSALDVTVQRTILDQLEKLTEEMGTSVFLITHDLGLAAERAHKVVVMYRGEIVESGDAKAILDNPQHSYTKQLLSAAPSLNSRSLITFDRPVLAADGTIPRIDPLVEVSDLTKTFRIRSGGLKRATDFTAVDSATFTIPRGKTVAVVGESGSGKSTTARMLLALEKPTSGSIRFEGTDTAGLKGRELFEFRSMVQPVFQNPYASLDPLYDVGYTIAEPLRVHKWGTPAEIDARVIELLEQVALPPEMAKRRPHELSGGQRQRVAIARALALNPKLVVLDEAVSALDVIVQAQILELLARLQQELGLAYLFISHDLAVVRMISHEVHVMQRGRIVESGAAEDVFHNPAEQYTQQLLAAIPGTRLSA